MSYEFWSRFLILLAIIALVDFLLFFGVKRLLKKNKKSGKNKRFSITFWLFTLIWLIYTISHITYIRYFSTPLPGYRDILIPMGIFMAIYLPKIITLIFIITENLLLFFFQFISFIFQNRKHYEFVRKIRRFKILTYLGILAGIGIFIWILYGTFKTRTNYTVVKQELRFTNLPAAFDNTKIVFISDLHIGSFFSQDELLPAIEQIRQISPDIILFGGDMINISAKETQGYTEMFSQLEAPLGKFSILGNHDMNDYFKYSDTAETGATANSVVAAEKDMGFRVLRNEHVFIYKGNDSIALVGIDSWGLFPFNSYGDLAKATESIPVNTFCILLSHIPSHWLIEVKNKTNINLTLSGHTHAMQLMIDNWGIKWSPASLKYMFWYGLYNNHEQYLYVNPGLGYLGFPARLGINPEITVITLHTK